jgi:hypothetical protein
LTVEISFHVQARDLSWNLFEKDVHKHSTCNLSNALGMYQSAMEKLNDTCLEFSPGSGGKLNTNWQQIRQEGPTCRADVAWLKWIGKHTWERL